MENTPCTAVEFQALVDLVDSYEKQIAELMADKERLQTMYEFKLSQRRFFTEDIVSKISKSEDEKSEMLCKFEDEKSLLELQFQSKLSSSEVEHERQVLLLESINELLRHSLEDAQKQVEDAADREKSLTADFELKILNLTEVCD